MAKQRSNYRAYLLRLWRTRRWGKVSWQASLESAETRERQGFANLDDLFDFLRKDTSEPLHSDRLEPGEDERFSPEAE